MPDQLHNAIIAGLADGPDDSDFELCAVELLKPLYPHLVWIPGGADAGADAYSDSPDGNPVFMVATTSERTLDNLRKSLNSYEAKGGGAKRIIFATSQILSATKRRNLSKEAAARGFSLDQSFDRYWFAEELYRSPGWRTRLLGIPGDLPALSAFPRARLPQLPLPLIGRERVLDELASSSTDLVCYGRPGVGKTAVLRQLAKEGWGLFLTDRTPGRLADAIRKAKPERIIVDDAHFDVSLLLELRHMRDEIDADFKIVAVSWPEPHATSVMANLEGAQAVEIPPLPRQRILEVIESAGVRGPREFQRLLVDQAHGRPGLAATLATAAINGNIRDVATGDALFAETQETYRQLLGEEAVFLLGMIALGDRAGVTLEAISRATGKDMLELQKLVRGMASGGTIDETPNRRLIVLPESLRYALVKAVFFGAGFLPLEVGFAALDDVQAAIVPLAAARHRGADVSIDQLVEIAKRGITRRGVEAIASLGEYAVRRVLEIAPHEKKAIGEAALAESTAVAFHLLMECAVGYAGQESSDPGHPMRSIAEYCGDRSGRVKERRILCDVVRQWVNEGGDHDVALRAIVCAVEPGFEMTSSDPGEGRTFQIQRGVLPLEAIEEIGSLWDHVIGLVEAMQCSNYIPLVQAFDEWVFPGRLVGPDFCPVDVRDWMRNHAAGLATRIAQTLPSERGVHARLSRSSKMAQLGVTLLADPTFEVLFPEDLESRRDDWTKEDERLNQAARAWARSVETRPAAEVVATIVDAEDQAHRADISYPRTTPVVASELASRVEKPEEYAGHFVKRRAMADIIQPFLVKSVEAMRPNWDSQIRELLDDPTYRLVAISVCLSRSTSPVLQARAVEKCDASAGRLLHVLCITREIQEAAIAPLLNHPDVGVAGPVATSIALERLIPSGCVELWEETIVRCPADDHWYSVVLRDRPELLKRWVEAWGKRWEESGGPELIPKSMVDLLRSIPADLKLEVLDALEAVRNHPLVGDIAGAIVGHDLGIAEQIFDRPNLARFQRYTLSGLVNEEWLRRAHLAVERGWSPQHVVEEAWLTEHRSGGSQSEYWGGFVRDFEALSAHDQISASIRDAGIALYSERRDRALAGEEREAIYGE